MDFGPELVEARKELAVGIRTAVAVVVDSNLAAVVAAKVEPELHTAGSDSLAVELDCMAGSDTGKEAVQHTGDTEDHSCQAEGLEDDTAAAEVVDHNHEVTVAHCRDNQAEVGDLAVALLASLVVCMLLLGLPEAALHMWKLVGPVVYLVEGWLVLVSHFPGWFVLLAEVGYLGCLVNLEEATQRSGENKVGH